MEKPNVYSHILKSTIVFGGMQGFNVLIGLLRNKFVALFIGPAGMGLFPALPLCSSQTFTNMHR